MKSEFRWATIFIASSAFLTGTTLWWSDMVSRRKRKRHLKQNLKEQRKSKSSIMKKKNLTSLSDFINEKVGPKGTKKRDKYDQEFEAFRLGVLIQQARQEKGLTQEQLAELAGTNKSYISKLEKDLKDVRFSTLQRIIKDGLGGQLQISIKI